MCDVIWYVLRTWAGATAPVPVSWGVYSPEWGRLAREACAHLRRRLVLSEEPGLLRPNWFCPGEWRSSLLCFTVCVLSVIKKKKEKNPTGLLLFYNTMQMKQGLSALPIGPHGSPICFLCSWQGMAVAVFGNRILCPATCSRKLGMFNLWFS